MAADDLRLFVSPAKAAELDRMLGEWQRFNGKWPAQAPGTPTFGCVPAPKMGKARDNIASRTFGSVDIWSGTPGQETQIKGLTSPVQEFNLLDRTITAGKFVWMFGQYIFGADFPAFQAWGTVGADVTSGGSATVTVTRYANGDNPGATITGYPDETYTGTTIKSGKYVRCEWDDKLQKYWIVGAAC